MDCFIFRTGGICSQLQVRNTASDRFTSLNYPEIVTRASGLRTAMMSRPHHGTLSPPEKKAPMAPTSLPILASMAADRLDRWGRKRLGFARSLDGGEVVGSWTEHDTPHIV